MRKLLLIYLPVFVLLTSSFTNLEPASGKKVKNVTNQQIDPKDWFIDEPTAMKMEAYYRDCKGCPNPRSRKFTDNPAVKAYLEQNFTIVSTEKRMGRYTDDDVERYRRARGLDANDPKGRVKGFSTIIVKYMVVPKNGSLIPQARAMYSDQYTVCPPPDSPPCN